jgi:formylglycine-generating enzyme required for sulfatase activity
MTIKLSVAGATVLLALAGFAVTGHSEAGTKSVVSAKPGKPGSTFKECRNCPEMVVIPAGSFIMGTPATEEYRREHEHQHKVTITKPFAVSKTEVTWDQWEACVRDGMCDGVAVETALRASVTPARRPAAQPNAAGAPAASGQAAPAAEPAAAAAPRPAAQANAGAPAAAGQGAAQPAAGAAARPPEYVDHGRGNRPVVGVSWYDVQAYIGWLNKKTGSDDTYRMLSEAEWEYAARAGTTTAYPWGEKLDHNHGNFGIAGPGLGGKAEGRDVWLAQTSPVASFPPNAFGLYDMHGNAFEWVEDCYNADLRELSADGSAQKQGNCSSRMFRSGSFISNPYMHRSGNRVRGYVPTTRGRNYLTIRLAKTLE